VISEGLGIRLAASLTGGHRNEQPQLMPLLAAISPVRSVWFLRGCQHDYQAGASQRARLSTAADALPRAADLA
jgi:hypothetical protein